MKISPRLFDARRRSLRTAWGMLSVAGVLAGPPMAAGQGVADDLVFTPVPRCRVIDTRLEGGMLRVGESRAFDVAGHLDGQGGAADCQIPFGSAVVAVIDLRPVESAGTGALTAWPFGGVIPPAALVEFAPDASGTVTSERLVELCRPAQGTCTRDLMVMAEGNDAHLVADVTGYFSPAVQYGAGAGLIGGATGFYVNTGLIQRRVQACPPGSWIRAIDASGGVACETDHDPAFSVGFGISLGFSGLTVDTDQVQMRGGLPCDDGAIRAFDRYGNPICGPAIQAGRHTDSSAIVEFTYHSFVSAPVVFVTPQGLSGTSLPPNSYCVVDDVTKSEFSYSCYGHVPEYVNWIAIGTY